MFHLLGQEPGESGPSGWDMKMLTRIIDERVTVAEQKMRHDPASKIEDVFDLDKAQADDLWRLNFESVRNLKGTDP